MSGKIQEFLQKAAGELCRFLEEVLPQVSKNPWKDCVENCLSREQKRRKASSLSDLDLQALLKVLDSNWYEISKMKNFSSDARHYAKEMVTVRNKCAHSTAQTIPLEDRIRYLDTLKRFLQFIDANKNLIDDIEAAWNEEIFKLDSVKREINAVVSSKMEKRMTAAPELPHTEQSLQRELSKTFPSLRESHDKGIDYLKRFEFDAALAMYNIEVEDLDAQRRKEGFNLDPAEYLDSYYGRGVVHLYLGDPRLASEDFTQVIQGLPMCINSYIFRGKARYEMSDFDGAIEDFNRVIELCEREKGKLAGIYYTDVDDFDFSHTIDDEAVLLAEAYNYRGLARKQKGDFTGALEDLSQAVKIKPNEPYFRQNLKSLRKLLEE
jgi:tetratricopeptide (TPR) repeat protein